MGMTRLGDTSTGLDGAGAALHLFRLKDRLST
jgi:hypothetical protein